MAVKIYFRIRIQEERVFELGKVQGVGDYFISGDGGAQGGGEGEGISQREGGGRRRESFSQGERNLGVLQILVGDGVAGKSEGGRDLETGGEKGAGLEIQVVSAGGGKNSIVLLVEKSGLPQLVVYIEFGGCFLGILGILEVFYGVAVEVEVAVGVESAVHFQRAGDN